MEGEVGALTLTRRKGERIRIQVSEGIWVSIKLSEIRESSVRLTVVAPKEMLVLRGELEEKEDE